MVFFNDYHEWKQNLHLSKIVILKNVSRKNSQDVGFCERLCDKNGFSHVSWIILE